MSKYKGTKLKSIIGWGVAALVMGGFVYWIATLPRIPDTEIVSRNGVHWHAKLNIKVKGEDVAIPANVGISLPGAHPGNMHTHEEDNIIHVEKQGIVTQADTRLANFFGVWDKDFSRDSILGNRAGENGVVKMLVNGMENLEFENYKIKDEDNIEIIYE